MGPGLYSEIGKQARDVLYKDYPKFTNTNDWRSIVFPRRNNLFMADVNIHWKWWNILKADVNFGTTSSLFTTVTVDELAPGLKALLSFRFPEISAKFEFQYLNRYSGVSCSFNPTLNPIFNFSGVVGKDNLAAGIEVAFDDEGDICKCDFGAQMTIGDILCSLNLNRLDTLSVTYYKRVNVQTSTAVGIEMAHTFSTNENTLTFGTEHQLDPLTTVKARLNTFGKAAGSLQHQWRPSTLIAVSSELNLRAIDEGPKIGLAILLK